MRSIDGTALPCIAFDHGLILGGVRCPVPDALTVVRVFTSTVLLARLYSLRSS